MEVFVEAKGETWVSSSGISFTSFFETGFLIGLECVDQAGLVSHRVWGPSCVCGYVWLFTWVLGFKLRSSCLRGQRVTDCAISSGPKIQAQKHSQQGVREPDSAAHAGSPGPAVAFGIEQAPNNRKNRRKGEREKREKEGRKEGERDWGTEGRREGMEKDLYQPGLKSTQLLVNVKKKNNLNRKSAGR